jgi:hypothetical protein
MPHAGRDRHHFVWSEDHLCLNRSSRHNRLQSGTHGCHIPLRIGAGDDDRIGTTQPDQRLTEAPGRQQTIQSRRIHRINQHHIEVAVQGAMLKGIVEHDPVHRPSIEQPSSDRCAIRPDCDNCLGTAVRNEIRLIPGLCRTDQDSLPVRY